MPSHDLSASIVDASRRLPNGAPPGPVLYLMPEYPSVSQTFIANEAAALGELGVPVLGYALERGAASRSAAPMDLVIEPPSRPTLVARMMRRGETIAAEVWRSRRERLTPREVARWSLARAHADYVLDAAKRAGITHIHAHFLARPSDVASLLAKMLGCEWSATAHGSDIYAPQEPTLLTRNLRTVAAVACANQGLRKRLNHMVAPRQLKTAVVHCGVDTRTLHFRSAPQRDQPPHLVTVGRLVETKGHWTILESALSLMRRDPSLVWTVIGDGPLGEALTQDPRSRELAPRLKFAGALDHAQILALLQSATAFVLPCEQDSTGDSDGIPVALMEAMAVGVPVVTVAVGGISELVIHGDTGFLVSQQDPVGLVATLAQILYEAPPEELERIREAARRKVETEFDLFVESGALVDLLAPYLHAEADHR